MAEHISGSEDAFVAKMNEKAQVLGMKHTHFVNCCGLDADGHYTSARDIALMSRELITNHPDIFHYTTIWMENITHVTKRGESEFGLSNTNKLIRTYKGATGLKTGSTSLALYNLSASATRDGLSLIAVIMKAPSTKIRFSEAQKLLDYGFNTFSFKQFGKKGDVVKNISIDKGVPSNVDAILETDAGTLIEKGKDKNIEQTLTFEENISAPISKGQKLGEITFTLDGKILSSINIVAQNNVEKTNLFSMAKKIYYSWIDLLRS